MKYYTLEELAEMHRVSVPTERNRLIQGRYPHAKKNGKWTVPQCCADGHETDTEPVVVEPTVEEVEKSSLEKEKAKWEDLKIIENLKLYVEGCKAGFKTSEEYSVALQRLEYDESDFQKKWLLFENEKSELEEREQSLDEDKADFEQKGEKVEELEKLLQEIADYDNQPKYDAYRVEHGMQAPYISSAAIENHWDAISLLLCEIAGIAQPIDEEEPEDDEDEE